MWSYAVLLWELATREVPFADMTPMEIGMKVMDNVGVSYPTLCVVGGKEWGWAE